MPGAAEARSTSVSSLKRNSEEIETAGRLQNVDKELRRLISEATGTPEYWSFAAARNGYSHCYFRYPAMMVAEMQRDLIGFVLQLQPGIRNLADPFSGSGTVLLEAMFRGLDAYAYDVNPLAILLCKSKTIFVRPKQLQAAVDLVVATATRDKRTSPAVRFRGLEKWFTPTAARQLSALHRAIRNSPNKQVRRFLWVCLAETVRQTSRSRTSTYKLHIRPGSDSRRLRRPLTQFSKIVERNIKLQSETREKLQQADLLRSNIYRHQARVGVHDARKPFRVGFDLIVCSPPYGDNQSTVPYGQNSFLPLQWINLKDVDGRISDSCLRNAYEIDNRSLGGRVPKGVSRKTTDELLDASPSLARAVRSIPREPADRRSRVLTFVADVDASLKAISSAAKTNAYLIFTLGNRRVGNRQIPLDAIVSELLQHYGVKPVLSLARKIPSKRMATRNSVAATISREQIVIFRKS